MSERDMENPSRIPMFLQRRDVQIKQKNNSQQTNNLQTESYIQVTNNMQNVLNNTERETNNSQKESNNLQQDSNKLQEESENEKDDENCMISETQEDVMNMFAAVWVKVEVPDEKEDENSIIYEPSEESSSLKPRKRRKLDKTLKCDQCDYTTTYKNCLELHVMGHAQAKPYSCTLCEYSTKYPTALHRHVVIKHQTRLLLSDPKTIPMYKCEQCDYSTFYKWNLNAHKRKHLEKQYKCTIPDCDYETAYRHNLQKHCKKHNENVFYKCDKCPFVTRFEGHITRHLAKIHNEVTENMNKCDLCDFSTKIKWRLNIHKQRSRQASLLKCHFCDFETFYMCESKKHKVTHYNEIYNKKPSINTESLQDESCDHAEPNETCELEKDSCIDTTPKYTLDPDCLDWNSIQVLESDDKDKPFQCHMCYYTARFKASVQRHFQRHHTGSQNRPYKCVNCDFSTKTKDQIALHNKRSRNDETLYCNRCKFTTKFKCQLVMHQKSHYDNKCPKCDYSCKHKYELQKHFTKVHLGTGIKCQYCEYKASRKDSLLCHETIHTGVKPFKCVHCDYMSVRKCLLNNHVKRHHSDIKSDVTVVSKDKIESLKLPAENILELQQLQQLDLTAMQ